jgi:hypothetical protein
MIILNIANETYFMKKTKLALTALVLVVVLFSACSKDDATSPTFSQRVQKNWNFEKIAADDYFSGTHYYDTIYGMPGDYLDFRTDNKAYSKISYPGLGSEYDTLSYSIVGESQIVTWYDTDPLDKDTINIETLTDNQFILSQRDNSVPPDYTDFRIFLNR